MIKKIISETFYNYYADNVYVKFESMRKLLFVLCPLTQVIIGCVFALSAYAFQTPQPVKQMPDVIEAYDVCRSFQKSLAENLDFARAYESEFTKNPARRRKIAIADLEFGSKDLKKSAAIY